MGFSMGVLVYGVWCGFFLCGSWCGSYGGSILGELGWIFGEVRVEV